ncbi:MAG: hypothetical protein JO281_01790 [Pseudonocardiales bacterium]|nr:hypothetical protein [Pseudonocardiales bacterium]
MPLGRTGGPPSDWPLVTGEQADTRGPQKVILTYLVPTTRANPSPDATALIGMVGAVTGHSRYDKAGVKEALFMLSRERRYVPEMPATGAAHARRRPQHQHPGRPQQRRQYWSIRVVLREVIHLDEIMR